MASIALNALKRQIRETLARSRCVLCQQNMLTCKCTPEMLEEWIGRMKVRWVPR